MGLTVKQRSPCGDDCVDLTSNSSYCGKCDRACKEGSCEQGRECLKEFTFVSGYVDFPTGKSCSTVCLEKGYTGCRKVKLLYRAYGSGSSSELVVGCSVIPPKIHPQSGSQYLWYMYCTCIVPFAS